MKCPLIYTLNQAFYETIGVIIGIAQKSLVNISHISTNYKEGYVEYIDKFIN
jgi:hypothetical protein